MSGGGNLLDSFSDPSRGGIDVHVTFQLCILKTVQMHVGFTFFE